MSRFWIYALAGLPLLVQAQAAPQTVTAPDLKVDGSAFVLKLSDGRELRGVKMQGAIVHLAVAGGRVASVRLDSIAPDPEDPELLRHEFRVQNEKGQWIPACPPNFYGETWGFPVALPEGHPGRMGAITLACASDAVGKCARFGYKPWSRGPKGEDLLPYHAACAHMVPADYCGDLKPHTKDGTSIDLYDDLGIQKPGSLDDAEYSFEAGWGPGGAVCVAKTRWPELQTLEALQQECPRLVNAATCDENSARKGGALLFNRSRRVPRTGD
ncbi:MAG: ADYC domain-containing protein [Panacagrimonas sp.]